MSCTNPESIPGGELERTPNLHILWPLANPVKPLPESHTINVQLRSTLISWAVKKTILFLPSHMDNKTICILYVNKFWHVGLYVCKHNIPSQYPYTKISHWYQGSVENLQILQTRVHDTYSCNWRAGVLSGMRVSNISTKNDCWDITHKRNSPCKCINQHSVPSTHLTAKPQKINILKLCF